MSTTAKSFGRSDMDTLGSSRRISGATPISAWDPTHHRLGESVTGKQFAEDVPIEKCLLRGRCVVRKPFGCAHELLLRNMRGSVVFDSVNPLVSDTVGELFLLAPQNLVRKISCWRTKVGESERALWSSTTPDCAPSAVHSPARSTHLL